ncbi:MAG: single-stranded-DNA-specific exonuclease RecJ [Desulfuromonadales bacterium]|nr:single-stranded-DNA-specific exonuclease RecJ [Desulfuromonadales bacterium]
MNKRWEVRDIPKTETEQPSGDLQLHPVISMILAARGCRMSDEISTFLSPALADMLDPFLLRGMAAAVARLLQARRNRDTICVYGDYDVDGITGTALLVSFLRMTGFCCDYFIPNRFDDGYGLNAASIESIITRGASLIISVDCGITAVAEAALCRQRGVDLIITDHHTPGESIPDACAVLNPLQPGCSYPFKSLAGVGVAFNLLVALRAGLRSDGAFEGSPPPDLRDWLDLVALGTIADVVPLVNQNRIYAFQGLQRLSSSTRPGLQALKRVAGIKEGVVSCGQVGFRLAPRLNAAGRMESAVPGVDLLMSDSFDESLLIADELDSANAERQAIERRIFDQAVARIESSGGIQTRRSIVLASEEWHQGVIGIVAARMVERYHRPTILIALTDDGMGKGSGRSIPGFHLLEALGPCARFLERFGGHRYAAGIGLKAEHVSAFAESFEAEAAARLTESDLEPMLTIDAELQPADVTKELALELKRLEPFGMGNPEPVLMLRTMTVTERRTVGEGHLRLRLTRDNCTFTAIAFSLADRETSGLIDIAFFPEMNQWNGSSSLQLRIRDLRPSE